LAKKRKPQNANPFANPLRTSQHGILFGGGYSGGTQCRLAAHKDVSMEDIEEAARVISELIK
jgi:hypothetical protein